MQMMKYAMPGEQEMLCLTRLSHIVDEFRALDPRMPSSYIAAFLAVAQKPGQTVTEYARMIGSIQPITSRILLEIGKKSRQGGSGLELVDSEPDPADLRQSRVFLTPKGRKLADTIMRLYGNV